MSDPVFAYVEAHDLGEIERVVCFSEKMPVPERDEPLPVALCQTDRGLWLIAAEDSQSGTHLDLAQARLHYRPGKIRDSLEVGELVFAIPFSLGAEARLAIGVGRLKPRRRWDLEARPTSARYVEAPSPVQRAWLEASLEPDELLLVWLAGTNEVTVPSPVLDGPLGRWIVLVTDRRASLVALSEVGDALELPLAAKALKIGVRRGSHTVHTSVSQVQTTRSGAEVFREIASLPSLPGPERVLEAARIVLQRGGPRQLDIAVTLLVEGAARGAGLAHIVACLLREGGLGVPLEADLEVALHALRETGAPADALVALWQAWSATDAAGEALVEHLRALGTRSDPWALALHEHLHALPRRRDRRGPAELARADIALAAHLLIAGQRERARELLEARLVDLPSERRGELVPPRDADLTAGDGGQALRTRVFELLAEARVSDQTQDVEALSELARLHPLVVGRLEALLTVAGPELAPRVRDVVAALQPGGLLGRVVPGPLPLAPRSPLTESLIEGSLRHPLSREEGPPLDRLRTLLAAVPTPEYGVLRDYCERLSPRTAADALAVFEDASRVLGVTDTEAYVSRGTKGVGVRAYDGQPPFLLIGGEHLDDASEFHMTRSELAFAVGAELAHLRLGHTRVTSSDAWNGAVAKARQGIDVALGVLPLRGVVVADRVAQAGSTLLAPVLREFVRMTNRGKRGRAAPKPQANVLSIINEELLVTHRVMQLTADRAGLVICGELNAALRAMLLVRRDFRDELPRVERRGMAPVLGQRAEDGHMAYQDLAVRVAALLRFYLSPDYTRLRAAVED